MRDWISDLLLFFAGVTGGILILTIQPYIRAAKKKRTEMVDARTRILAGIKERHDEEILHEAFRTTEAIRGELNKSLQTLRTTLMIVRDPAPKQTTAQPNSTTDLTEPVEPNESPS
jgi:hypothetical protein